MTERKHQEAQEAEVIDETKSTDNAKKERTDKFDYRKDNWSVNRIFWGLLFVVIGGLMLASNFNFVKVDWANLWRLWPLVVISCGLSILTIRNWIWKLLSFLLILATMGAIVWVAVGGQTFSGPTQTYNATTKTISSSVKQAEVNIKAGASDLTISSKDQSVVAKSKLESNVAKLSDSSTVTDGTQEVNLNMDTVDNNYWWTGNIQSVFEVQLCRNLPIKLNVDAGASNTNIDVSRAKITDMNLKIGASNIDVKLGNLVSQTNLNIDSGVSSIVIRVPKTSGVQVKIEGGLTSKNLSDLKDVGNDTYESTGYSDANSKIDIIAKIGVSSFTIERY